MECKTLICLFFWGGTNSLEVSHCIITPVIWQRCGNHPIMTKRLPHVVKVVQPLSLFYNTVEVSTTTVEICHSGTITSLFHHGENPPRLPCRSILTRDSFWSPELSLIKRLISSKLWHRNVFTVGTRLRTPSALPRGCSPRLCRLTGPLLYKQLRMLKCEKLSLSAAARALIKVVGPGGG